MQRASTAASWVRSLWAHLTIAELPRDRWRNTLMVVLVALPIAFNAVALWPEVSRPIPNVNDDAFHYLMILSGSDAIARGENPLDSWGPEMDFGAPRFLFYQNLPALVVIALDRLTFGLVGLLTLLNLTRYVLMITLPLTVFWSMRRLEFSSVAAAGAAAASSLVSTNGLYGIEYDSYVWRGWGMFTQLYAIHLSFITIACLWRLARSGTGAVRTALAASVLVLSHLLYAEMMVITGVVIFLVGVDRSALRQRILQFAGVGLLIAISTSYLWLTYLVNRPYVGESPYDATWKLDSFGARQILDWLFTGELFDSRRWPVFTVVLALGIASLVLVRGRQRYLALALFLVWLVLYFGRSVWGPFAGYIPSGSMLLFHRFIGSFHIASILLIGMGFEAAWRILSLLPRPATLVAGALACVLLLTPAIVERQAYYADNTRWMNETYAAYQNDEEARRILDTLRALPRGRVYAGLRANWGESLKIDQVPMYRVLLHEGLWTVSVPLPSIVLNSEFSFHFDDRNRAFYDLYDVRYVVAPRGLAMPDFLSPLLLGQRYALYSLPDATSATFASRTVTRSVEGKLDLFFANRAWLLGPEMPARSFIRWNYPAAPSAPQQPVARCADGTIMNEVLEPARIIFDTSCASASTIVIKTTFHPNWRVTVDGVEQPTFMVSPSYIGVDVPGGTHRVEAEYRSSMLRTVLLVVGVGAFAIVILGRRLVRKRHARRAVATHGALSVAFEDDAPRSEPLASRTVEAPADPDAQTDADRPRT